MYRSIRPTWVTAAWVALLLVLVAFAASQARLSPAPPTGMVAAFVDINGNDIDDTCEDPETVQPDETTAAEAEAAASAARTATTAATSAGSHTGRAPIPSRNRHPHW